jgi:bifunctional UDP-N-acetylglucosamine pyrophosphorylase/glucosamine-1-phosphate N-acetyltransferase
MKSCAIVLAAGKGTRMNSELPKVLNSVNGKPMVFYSLDRLIKSKADYIVVVVGFEADMVKNSINGAGYNVIYALQDEQLGTGHAVLCGLKAVPNDCDIAVVTYGDNPFIPSETFDELIDKAASDNAIGAISTINFDEPMAPAFGRIKRDRGGKIISIVEQKNCNADELNIKECNGGPVAYKLNWMKEALKKVKRNDVSGEYYLTDLVKLATDEGKIVQSVSVPSEDLALGINTKEQLEKAEHIKQ